jgi:putative endonuclease
MAPARHTAKRLPVELIWSAQFDSIREAFQLEQRLHGWSHSKKLALIEGRFDDLPALARGHSNGRRGLEDGDHRP